MKIYKIIIFLVSITLLSCSGKSRTVAKDYHYDYFLRTAEIGENTITQTPVVCDLNVDFTKRVSGTSRAHFGKDRAERARDEAYFNALVNNNVDVLVSPIYQIEQSDKEATAVVYGFAGMYTNQRPKNKALEEVQGLDSTSFYKYELVWKNATIAPAKDYVLTTKGTPYCSTCPANASNKGKVKGGNESSGESGSGSPTIVYTEERVFFNPYGPQLIYGNPPFYRKEQVLKEYSPVPPIKNN